MKLGIKKTLKYIKQKIQQKDTYAQHKEDIVSELLIGEVKKFIDIGANDGINCSNSFLLALNGAKGLCFEPVKENFESLKWLYILNKKVICIDEGISNEVKEVEIQSDGLISFITATQDEKLKELLTDFYNREAVSETIKVKPLNYWLEIYPEFREVDLVSLDIEGHELYALQGIEFKKFKTKMFIIETHGKNKNAEWKHQDYKDIDDILGENGYRPLLRNELNTFWIDPTVVSEESLKQISEKFANYEVIN